MQSALHHKQHKDVEPSSFIASILVRKISGHVLLWFTCD